MRMLGELIMLNRKELENTDEWRYLEPIIRRDCQVMMNVFQRLESETLPTIKADLQTIYTCSFSANISAQLMACVIYAGLDKDIVMDDFYYALDYWLEVLEGMKNG